MQDKLDHPDQDNKKDDMAWLELNLRLVVIKVTDQAPSRGRHLDAVICHGRKKEEEVYKSIGGAGGKRLSIIIHG